MRKKLKEIGPYIGDQKPVRDGVYKRRFPRTKQKLWCLFSKGAWYCSAYEYRDAKRELWVSNFQDLQWWGVKK